MSADKRVLHWLGRQCLIYLTASTAPILNVTFVGQAILDLCHRFSGSSSK